MLGAEQWLFFNASISIFKLLRVSCYAFQFFFMLCETKKTARLHGGKVPSSSSPLLDEPNMSSRYRPACLCEKRHCKVHLRRWAGNDTLTVWLQWQWRLNLWFVFSTFPDRCLSNTSFDKEPRCGAPFPKAISQKMLKIVCRFICFRVKCWFQPIDLGLGVHHFLLETSKWKYLIPCHTSYSRGVLKPETKLTTKLLTFCHCRNPSVLSPKTSCIFKSTHWHWCSINTVALWEGIISEPSWRSLEQL